VVSSGNSNLSVMVDVRREEIKTPQDIQIQTQSQSQQSQFQW
jgi:hypothetical protein